MNILLVESDGFMRSLFQAALERDGFRVMAVKDNQEGLAASGARLFDLVVAQFFAEADVAGIADLLAALRARAPQCKLLAVISGFRMKSSETMSMQRLLNPWRTVDLTWGGHVLLDACRDAAAEQRSRTLAVAANE
jgi:DNA-binding NtrC family response regulator